MINDGCSIDVCVPSGQRKNTWEENEGGTGKFHSEMTGL
jgi:hypothetical protein